MGLVKRSGGEDADSVRPTGSEGDDRGRAVRVSQPRELMRPPREWVAHQMGQAGWG